MISIKPAYLDRKNTADYVSLSVPTMDRMIARQQFPAPRQIGAKRVGWLVRELDTWCEARPQSNNLPPDGSGYGRAGKPGGQAAACE